jgi:hypothetical protein
MRYFAGEVFITHHARDRFLQRRIDLSRNAHNEHCNVYKKMLNMLFRSRVVKYLRKEDGRVHEYRVYQGCLFVCERQIAKNFWEKDKVTVITVELTESYIKERMDKGYAVEDMEIGEFMTNKILA